MMQSHKITKAGDDMSKTALTRGADGKYRWSYEISVLKNPMIFMTVWKILAVISAGIFVIIFLADLSHPERIPNNLKFCGIYFIGMTVMVWLGCLIYSLMIGGKYCAEFEMDEKGITHRQAEWQAERLKKAMRFSLRYQTMTRTEISSDFSKVRRVRAYPKRNTIRLDEPFAHNQIFVPDEDFEFVRQFIISHCGSL